jgi:hypothetical protein
MCLCAYPQAALSPSPVWPSGRLALLHRALLRGRCTTAMTGPRSLTTSRAAVVTGTYAHARLGHCLALPLQPHSLAMLCAHAMRLPAAWMPVQHLGQHCRASACGQRRSRVQARCPTSSLCCSSSATRLLSFGKPRRMALASAALPS